MTRFKAASLVVTMMILLAGCTMIQSRKAAGKNPYLKTPFYARYLNTGSQLDKQIQSKLEALKQNPHSAPLHNDLGLLLAAKGFPKDAEVEYNRAIESDHKYYQAWYNLGLVREAEGDRRGSEQAFRRTVKLKPGQAGALFELGLIEEGRGNRGEAVAYYKKAFLINQDLLDVRTNPRILDSNLVIDSLLEMYPVAHDRRSILPSPAVTAERRQQVMQDTASPQPAGANIVTPAPAVGEPAVAVPIPSPQSPIRAPKGAPAPPPGRAGITPAGTGGTTDTAGGSVTPNGTPIPRRRRAPNQPAPPPPTLGNPPVTPPPPSP